MHSQEFHNRLIYDQKQYILNTIVVNQRISAEEFFSANATLQSLKPHPHTSETSLDAGRPLGTPPSGRCQPPYITMLRTNSRVSPSGDGAAFY